MWGSTRDSVRQLVKETRKRKNMGRSSSHRIIPIPHFHILHHPSLPCANRPFSYISWLLISLSAWQQLASMDKFGRCWGAGSDGTTMIGAIGCGCPGREDLEARNTPQFKGVCREAQCIDNGMDVGQMWGWIGELRSDIARTRGQVVSITLCRINGTQLNPAAISNRYEAPNSCRK